MQARRQAPAASCQQKNAKTRAHSRHLTMGKGNKHRTPIVGIRTIRKKNGNIILAILVSLPSRHPLPFHTQHFSLTKPPPPPLERLCALPRSALFDLSHLRAGTDECARHSSPHLHPHTTLPQPTARAYLYPANLDMNTLSLDLYTSPSNQTQKHSQPQIASSRSIQPTSTSRTKSVRLRPSR